MAVNITSKWLGASDNKVDDGVTNANYRIWIAKGIESVSTVMPENWSTNLDISWSPQFANLLQDGMSAVLGAGRAESLKNVLSAAGYQPQNKLLSAQIWQGTSYVTLNIPFIFKVTKDVRSELLNPIKQLMSWSLPTCTDIHGVGTGMMKAPYSPLVTGSSALIGSISNSTKRADSGSTDAISVQFGRFFQLPECVITNISQTFDSIFDENGFPLSAKVDVSVTSAYVITKEDIENMYRLS